jgi:hypothetical protein
MTPAEIGRALAHMDNQRDAEWRRYQRQEQATVRKTTVKARLTHNRARPVVENDAYAAFAHRILTAYARRVATGDIDALTLMTALSADIDTAIHAAVTGLRQRGYSWTEIGNRLGITRQAAQQRWGAHP